MVIICNFSFPAKISKFKNFELNCSEFRRNLSLLPYKVYLNGGKVLTTWVTKNLEKLAKCDTSMRPNVETFSANFSQSELSIQKSQRNRKPFIKSEKNQAKKDEFWPIRK